MTSTEQQVRVLLEMAGLRPGDDEVNAIVTDFPAIRDQAEALRKFLEEGIVTDTCTPAPVTAAGTPKPPRRGRPGTTISEMAAWLRDGTTSACELTSGLFARIDRLDDVLGAYVCTFREAALEAAALADRELASGYDRGPLHGIPLAIKDIVATIEAPTRANSQVALANWTDQRDAAAVRRLREAGATILGKASTSEYALGLPDPDKGFPQPRNPWDTSRFAGGSSSGTAIAVAAGMALGGLGSDTGGSNRHPAALNGVTGLKVSFGRVPMSGVIPLASTLDTLGPIARSARDCALLLQAIAGDDAADPGSAREPVPAYMEALDGTARGLRIGWPKRYFFETGNVSDPVRTAVEAAIAVLHDAGAAVLEVSLPNADMAKMANNVVLLSEALAYHRSALSQQWLDYGKYLRRLLASGVLFTATDYVRAKRMAAVFDHEVAHAMQGCDALIVPTMPAGARLLEETDPTMMDRWSSAAFTSQWNVTGRPACAVPVGFDPNGMPVSMQIIGNHLAEATILQVADAYQQLTEFHLMTPALAGAGDVEPSQHLSV